MVTRGRGKTLLEERQGEMRIGFRVKNWSGEGEERGERDRR